MDETVYIIDNMVICSRQISPYLNTEFLIKNCVVIDEVIYESRNSARAESIRSLRHSLSPKDLEFLKNICHDCIDKYRVLKLYEGCADALLLATALAINECENTQMSLLFNKVPIIVTEERALRIACDDLNIKWISQKDFIDLVKAVVVQELPLEI